MKKAIRPEGKTLIERELVLELLKEVQSEIERLEDKLFG